MNAGDRVRLKATQHTVQGGTFPAGTEFVVWRRFETTSGERLALADDRGRVRISHIKADKVEAVE